MINVGQFVLNALEVFMKLRKLLKKGFTLIELVVVIAVIAVLAGVSVAAYFGVTESANDSQALQESTQVQDMYTQWYIFNADEIKNQAGDKVGKELIRFQLDGYKSISFDVNSSESTTNFVNTLDNEIGDLVDNDNKEISFYGYLENNGFNLNKINYSFIKDSENNNENYLLFLINSNNRYSTFIVQYSYTDGLYGNITETNNTITFKSDFLNWEDDSVNQILETYNKENNTSLVIDKHINKNEEELENQGSLEFGVNDDGSFNVVGENGSLNECVKINYNGTSKGNLIFNLRKGKEVSFINSAVKKFIVNNLEIEKDFLGYSINGNKDVLYNEEDFPLKVNDFIAENQNNITIDPVYDDDETLGALIKVGTEFYGFQKLEDAIEYGNNSEGEVTIFAQNRKDYVLNKDTTIKNNVTLILPHCEEASNGLNVNDFIKQGNNIKKLESKDPSEPGFYATDEGGVVESNVLYSKLRINEGVILTIEGRVVVNSFSNNAVLGNYAEIENNGKMIIKNGAELDSHGLITGTGSIEAEEGSTVLEKMFIADWSSISRNYTVLNAGIFPFNQYYFNNIRCNLKINKGVIYDLIGRIYSGTAKLILPVRISLIAPNNSIFKVEDGYVVKYVKESKQFLDIYGKISDTKFNFAMTINIGISKTINIDTSTDLPIYI